jgi:hypothetical protein
MLASSNIVYTDIRPTIYNGCKQHGIDIPMFFSEYPWVYEYRVDEIIVALLLLGVSLLILRNSERIVQKIEYYNPTEAQILSKESFMDVQDTVANIIAEKRIDKPLNNDGVTCLHLAAIRGNLEILQLVLNAKPGINSRDCSGNTALHLAKNKLIADRLVKSEIDVNIQNKNSEVAGIAALKDGRLDVAIFIFSLSKTNKNLIDNENMSLTDYLYEKGIIQLNE